MDVCAYLKKNHHITLTARQAEAANSDAARLLLLAVPGAGKTTALTARVARLLLEGRAAPGQLLSLTFNKEAARDMARRWEGLFGELTGEAPSFSTIHSFCYRILREHAARRGTQVPRLLSDGGEAKAVAGLYREASGSRLTDDRLDELLNALGYCVNMLLSEPERRALEREVEGLKLVWEGYRDFKRREGLMDFDDMLSFALEVLRRFPAVAEDLRERYPYLCLDEAQDTSRLQHAIIRRLEPHNLFMVGDEDQSIYHFRGAYPQALLDFERDYPGAKVITLEQNFRSTASIVAPAANFIACCPKRYNKGMKARRKGGEPIAHTCLPELWEQYDYVAQRLAALPQDASAAVLYRGGITAAAMADRLLRRGLAFQLRQRRSPLLQDPVVRDMAAFMRLALDPGDGEAFLTIYYKLGCYLTREQAEAAARWGEGDIFTALMDGADYPGKSTARLGYLSAALHNLRKLTPAKALDKILRDFDYLEFLQSRAPRCGAEESMAQRLGALRSIAASCGELAGFLERLMMLDEVLALEQRTGAPITLSTVHSAKGREFDRVWLIDLLDGVFPTAQAVEEAATGLEDALEEEARLFYVAVTRARNAVELVTARRQGELELLPSRFVERLIQGGEGPGPGLEERIRALGLRRGARLIHRVYGAGTVESISRITGEFTVRFAKTPPKTFDLEAMGEDGPLRGE